MIAVLAVLLATTASAQESQFVFDPVGNLLVQSNEVAGPPQIVGQPQMQVVRPGATATFSVVALDASGLSYQWFFSGAALVGQIGDALLISNASSSNEGYYSVVLANSSGSVTSSPAPLWIDSRGCGMPDWWQLYYFGNLAQNATDDLDGDGVSNLQEFLDGTNPTNSASVAYHLRLLSDGGLVQVVPNQSSYSNGTVVTLTATAIAPARFHAWTGDLVSQSNTVTLVMNTNKSVFARFTPIDFFWTNGSGGDWSVATNWNPNLVPLANDNAQITLFGVTVTVTNPTECLGLVLGGYDLAPNLSLSNTLTVHGASVWGDGQISGTGRIIVDTGASLTITNQGIFSQGVNLNASTLENGGSTVWTGAGYIIGGGYIITNRPGALFESQNAATLSGGRFDNAGTFRKTVNPGTNTVTVSFNNYGALDNEAGTLLFTSGLTNLGTVSLAPGTTNRFTSVGGFSSGTFNVTAAALVEWTGGVFVNAGGQLNGGGLYRINANGGSLLANTDVAVSNLDLQLGALDGSGTVTINNLMNWTAGSMTGSGRAVIAPGATLNLANANGATLSRTLDNAGTILWTGAGTLNFSSGILTNRAGALFEQQGAGSFASFNAPYELDNAGIFQKTVDPGTNLVAINFNNYGTVDIESGTLTWYHTFTNNGTVMLGSGATNRFAATSPLSSGPFNAARTALVEVDGGNLTLVPGGQLNGGGLYRINANGGGLVANTDMAVSNLDLQLGALDGSGTVTVANAMNWVGGSMTGSGRTIIAPGATLNLANPNTVVLSRTLDNGGTAFWTGSGTFYLSSGIITNRSGALFEVQNAGSFTPFSSPYWFDNAGVFRKSLNTGTVAVGVPFTNYGAVDIRLGVLAANNGYVSTPNALLNCALGGTTAGTNYGQLQVAGAVTLNGALRVVLTNGFLPATNNIFTLVAAGARNGTFANFYYPSNTVTMQLSNTPSSVIVQVTGVSIPPLLLLTPAIAGSNVLLTWTAFSNVNYRVEFNPNLAPSNWSALPGDVTSSSNFASKLDSLTPTNRFYRLRVLP